MTVSFVVKIQDKIEEFLDGEVFKYSKSVLTEKLYKIRIQTGK